MTYTTSVAWSSGRPARRIRSAVPCRRKYSMDRALVVLHRGLVVVSVALSMTRVRTPRRPSSVASVIPTGPDPTTTTSQSVAADSASNSWMVGFWLRKLSTS